MEKMTYVKALEIAIASLGEGEVVDKLNALKASIVKRNASDRKPSKTQVLNANYKQDIIDYLKCGEKFTATEILNGVTSFEGLSNQKIAALLAQLVDDNIVKRETIKRRSYFSLA